MFEKEDAAVALDREELVRYIQLRLIPETECEEGKRALHRVAFHVTHAHHRAPGAIPE